jgi:hypothetical protein
MPSVCSAQAKSTPADTWENVPVGALVWPLELLPQQAIVPSIRSAHAWLSPADTWEKVPVGTSFMLIWTSWKQFPS